MCVLGEFCSTNNDEEMFTDELNSSLKALLIKAGRL